MFSVVAEEEKIILNSYKLMQPSTSQESLNIYQIWSLLYIEESNCQKEHRHSFPPTMNWLELNYQFEVNYYSKRNGIINSQKDDMLKKGVKIKSEEQKLDISSLKRLF